jgi:hypothetical protein
MGGARFLAHGGGAGRNPAARGGEVSGLGRHRVHGESNLGVKARRISSVRGAPWWRASGGKELLAAGRRSGGGRRLRGHGAAMSSGGGRGGNGGLRGRSERPVRAVALGGQGIGRWLPPQRHL